MMAVKRELEISLRTAFSYDRLSLLSTHSKNFSVADTLMQ